MAALVGAAEGLTVLLLQRGLAAENFRTVLDHPNLGLTDSPALDSSIDATARAVLLGMVALFGVLPAALGFLLQMLFRQAVILVLIATVPITAAGLLANTTASWFWRWLRWMLAAILMKPALALVLVVGVNMLSGADRGRRAARRRRGAAGLAVLPAGAVPAAGLRRARGGRRGRGRGPARGRRRRGRRGARPASVAEQVNAARFDAAAGRPCGRLAVACRPGSATGPGRCARRGGRAGVRGALAGRTGGAGDGAGTATPARVRAGTDGRTARRSVRTGRAVPGPPAGPGAGPRPADRHRGRTTGRSRPERRAADPRPLRPAGGPRNPHRGTRRAVHAAANPTTA